LKNKSKNALWGGIIVVNKAIAVLGGGSGGHTMAADLTLGGFKVNFYEHPNFEESFKKVLETQTVTLKGIGRRGTAKLNFATTNIKDAIEGVEMIHVVIPATGHDLFFNELIPNLEDGQTVVIWAGDFGSLYLKNLINNSGLKLDVNIVETHTLPYGTRLREPGVVELVLSCNRVLASCIPSKKNDDVLPDLQALWPGVIEKAENVLKVAFSNPNPICHPPGSLLNVGRIQWSNGDFYMYREGITEAVARVIKNLYNETAELAAALGVEVLKYDDRDFNSPGTIMSRAFEAPFNTLKIIGDIQGPKSIQDRYITEDLPYGLVPMSMLGDKLGVPTPLIDSIITIGSNVCDTDFWAIGRTLDKLGIDNMTKEEIISYING
jgi:opine dehydrogenase